MAGVRVLPERAPAIDLEPLAPGSRSGPRGIAKYRESFRHLAENRILSPLPIRPLYHHGSKQS